MSQFIFGHIRDYLIDIQVEMSHRQLVMSMKSWAGDTNFEIVNKQVDLKPRDRMRAQMEAVEKRSKGEALEEFLCLEQGQI